MPATNPDLRHWVRQGADGAITAHASMGARLVLRDERVAIDLAVISAVGIKHLDQVASHAVNTIAGSRSHLIRFVNGALLRYAYNDAGQLLDLSGEGLACLINEHNELLFYLPAA